MLAYDSRVQLAVSGKMNALLLLVVIRMNYNHRMWDVDAWRTHHNSLFAHEAGRTFDSKRPQMDVETQYNETRAFPTRTETRKRGTE